MTLTSMRPSVSREMMLQQESLSTLLTGIWTFFIVAGIILATLLNDWFCVFGGLKVLQGFSHVMLR